MSRWIWLALAAALAAALAGCGPRAGTGVAVPTLPVSFELNLATARDCEFLGTVAGMAEARELGANLIVVFRYTRYESSTNGVRTVAYSNINGKAVRCPPPMLERLLASEETDHE